MLVMDCQVSSSDCYQLSASVRPRTDWTTGMDRHFVDIMLEQVKMGFRHGSSFTKDSWQDMINSMNKAFGLQLDKVILMTRFKKFRRQYKIIKVLLELDGFNWDEKKEMVVAGGDAWNSYLKAHPEAKSVRNKRVPNFKDLCVIYGEDSTIDNEKVAEEIDVLPPVDNTENNVISEVPLNDSNALSIRPLEVVEETEKHTPNTNDRPRLFWTPTMDRYFIEIMVEQVNKGYKNDTMFQKKAWNNMVVLFNKKFEFGIGEKVLRGRINKLRLKYYTIKSLLDHEGCVWDDQRQIVTADDLVWDDYIKDHPEARSYRTTAVPDYANLAIIFGNESSKGRGSVGQDSDLAIKALGARTRRDYRATQSPNISAAHGDQCVSSESMEEVDRSTPTSQRPITIWKPPMNRCFIEMMLEHTKQGNIIGTSTGTSFHKEAWAKMVEKLNSEFGLQLNKEILGSRFKRLRQQYNAMKNILDCDGFQWDETRKMILADDNVWDKYLKEQPESRKFVNKTLPSYHDLRVIYGNSGARHSSSDHNINTNRTSETELFLSEGNAHNLLESSSHSSRGAATSNQFGKRPFVEPLIPNSGKAQRTTDEGMADALRQMACAVTSLANCKKERESSISCEQVVKALKSVPDIDEDLFLDACDLLEDEQKAKMFLALDVHIRKKWLIRKLRSQ